MKYITILCSINNDRAKVGRKTYWLTKDSNIYAKGFALLEETWQGTHRLLRFLNLDSKNLSVDFSAIGDDLEGKE